MADENVNPGECRPPTLEDLLTICRSLNAEAAKYIVIGGFAIALIAAIVFGVIIPQYIAPRVQRAILAKQVVSLLSAEAQICTEALGSAKNFGIVPQYGQLASV